MEPANTHPALQPDTQSGHQGGPGRGGHPWVLVTGLVLVLGVLLVVLTDLPALTVAGALLLGLVILRLGWGLLAQLATPPPPPPDPGTLRKVKITYRCEVCGAEVRMTAAASEDPEPPRHCMEEMQVVSSQDDL